MRVKKIREVPRYRKVQNSMRLDFRPRGAEWLSHTKRKAEAICHPLHLSFCSETVSALWRFSD